MSKPVTIILSGGGTAGHIYPAVATAKALKRLMPQCRILFIGALGRMEMQLVPQEGFDIVGVNIAGINRHSLWKNIGLPFKMLRSLAKTLDVLRSNKASVCAGFGGYASAPLMLAARLKKIPYLIQEQNSYAGVTNKRFAGAAAEVCVAYPDLQKYFGQARLVLTGNPVRQQVINIGGKAADALAYFNLQPHKKTILITGGSLGARTLNNSVLHGLAKIQQEGVQLIWQCGKLYYDELAADMQVQAAGIKPHKFIERMDYAYAAADLIISRAGAGTISELCNIGKPVVLVPSPNVAEDHQTKNARAIERAGACRIVADAQAQEILIDEVLELLRNTEACAMLSENIKALAIADADERIAREILKLVKP